MEMFIDGNDDGSFQNDHLERYSAADDIRQRPSKSDIQDTALSAQILPVDVIGVWDYGKL